MLDHVSIAVRDIKNGEAFYTALLGTIGLSKLREWPDAAVGYGKTYPEFWINVRPDMARVPDDSGVHFCLRAPSKGAVDAFHAAALAQGGASDGEPGFRKKYKPRYYAAFVRDPDGNRIEAVTFVDNEASMIFGDTPTVVQRSPVSSLLSIRTRVTASVPPLRMRTR
jgi:catechol 2,3-dioxygenase-like lactoylglutathione lyase family enzyme